MAMTYSMTNCWISHHLTGGCSHTLVDLSKRSVSLSLDAASEILRALRRSIRLGKSAAECRSEKLVHTVQFRVEPVILHYHITPRAQSRQSIRRWRQGSAPPNELQFLLHSWREVGQETQRATSQTNMVLGQRQYLGSQTG